MRPSLAKRTPRGNPYPTVNAALTPYGAVWSQRRKSSAPKGRTSPERRGRSGRDGVYFKRGETVFSVRMSILAGFGLAVGAMAQAADVPPLPIPKPDLVAAAASAAPTQLAAVRSEPESFADSDPVPLFAPETRGETRIGDSGLPVPRFVSLKSGEVYLREGPSPQHRVQWVYVRRGLPVEVIAEYDVWRRIRDADGVTGWVHKGMLDGRRSVVMTAGENVPLRGGPAPDAPVVAYAEAGVIARLKACGGGYCEVEARSIAAYAPRERVWGVYQDETVE